MSGQTIRNIIIVTVVTVLIWAYAESESLRTAEQTATVGFASPPGSGRAIWLSETPDRPSIEIKLRLEGATAAIDALRNQLNTTVVLTPGVELPTEPAEYAIDLRTALRASSVFAKSGVTLAEVTPATVAIRVDALASKQVPVRVELPLGTETVGPPEVQQTLATITLPESLLPALDDLPVLAPVDQVSLAPLTPGRLERIPGVPLQAPQPVRGKPFVSIEPKSVTVTVTLRDQTASIDLPTVPVQIRISPAAYAEWEFDIPQDSRFLRDVHVSGPSDLITQIREGRLPIIAYISLTPEDLTRGATDGEVSKEAVFSDLPVPNNPLKFSAEDRLVKILIRRRPPEDPDRPSGPNGPPPS